MAWARNSLKTVTNTRGWQDGRMHGRGTYNFANGDEFVGHWDRGVYHGVGTFYYADGSLSRRNYDRGRLDGLHDFNADTERSAPAMTRDDMIVHTAEVPETHTFLV